MSNQEQARLLFRRLCEQLHDYELYDEVRTEVMDMSNYLDTDSIRRQANTVLRLTVVTIFGLIGTIVTSCTIVKSKRLADFHRCAVRRSPRMEREMGSVGKDPVHSRSRDIAPSEPRREDYG